MNSSDKSMCGIILLGQFRTVLGP